MLSPASPCRYRAGIQHDPWCIGISVRKIKPVRYFPFRSTRMKNDRYHSWNAPCSFRVATGSPVLRPASSRCEIPECTRWLHGRNMVPSKSDTDHFSSVCSGTENQFSVDIPVLQGPCQMPARCIHGDAGDNTDDPRAMIRDDPWCNL